MHTQLWTEKQLQTLKTNKPQHLKYIRTAYSPQTCWRDMSSRRIKSFPLRCSRTMQEQDSASYLEIADSKRWQRDRQRTINSTTNLRCGTTKPTRQTAVPLGTLGQYVSLLRSADEWRRLNYACDHLDLPAVPTFSTLIGWHTHVASRDWWKLIMPLCAVMCHWQYSCQCRKQPKLPVAMAQVYLSSEFYQVHMT